MATAGAPTGAVFRLATPRSAGPVAVFELVAAPGVDLEAALGLAPRPAGVMRLERLADIDMALVVRLSDSLLWLMPHGGTRIAQRLTQWLGSLGLQSQGALDPQAVWPEAESRDQALALEALGRAASPLAVDLLLDQHRRWQEHRSQPRETMDEISRRSRFLNRLLVPPLVVVVGRPNVGKSTLANALLGREAAITSDVQGTTRDYVVTQLDLAGLVVRWCDTPGRRDTTDQIEREAIDIAGELIGAADCLIGAAAPGIGWPDLPRPADLHVQLKADLPGGNAAEGALRVSARQGSGLSEFVSAVREFLVPRDVLAHPGPWLFDERLAAS